MKTIVISLVLLLSFNAYANDESLENKRLIVQELIEVSDMRHVYELSIDATVQQLSQSPNFSGDEFLALMDKSLNWDVLSEFMIDTYSELFTAEEIKSLIAFYQTPAGKAFIYKTPQVTAKASEFMRQKTIELIQNHQASLEAQKKLSETE